MEPQPPHDNPDETAHLAAPDERAEQAPDLAPRIYVASLADFNAGRLHGRWLDAGRDAAELETDIAAMLAASPEPVAEDWAIHDYEGFGGLRVDAYENLDTVSQLARGIAEHGEAFAAWAQLAGSEPDTVARFEDAYRGTWPSTAAYVEDLVDSVGALDFLDAVEWLRPYVSIDYDGLARDLTASGNLQAVRISDGVAVFEDSG